MEYANDIEDAIVEAKKSTTPFIIDAVVSNGELSLPPHIDREQEMNFATSKVKEGLQALMGDKKQ